MQIREELLRWDQPIHETASGGGRAGIRYWQTSVQKIAIFHANFENMVQKILTSGNCVQFPEIPAKFREIFAENLRSIFSKILKASAKITEFS